MATKRLTASQAAAKVRNEYLNYYAAVPHSKYVNKAVKSYTEGRRSLSSLIRLARKGYGVQSGTRKAASLHVSGVLDPQLAAIRATQTKEKDITGRTITESEKKAKVAKGDISQIYGILERSLGKNAQTVRRGYETTAANVGTNYDRLAQAINQQYGQGQAATGTELERLGIGAALPQATERMTADKNFLAGLAQTNKAQNVSNLQTQGAGIGGLLTAASGNAQSEGVQRQAQIASDNLKFTNDLRAKLSDSMKELEAKMASLSGTRRAQVSDTYEKLKMAQQELEMEARKQQFAEKLALEKLGISKYTAETGRINAKTGAAYKSGQLNLSAQRLQLDRQKLRAQLARENDPLRRRQLELQIANVESQIRSRSIKDKKLLEPKPSESAKKPKGYGEAVNLLSADSLQTDAGTAQHLQTLFKHVMDGGYDERGNNTKDWSGPRFTGNRAIMEYHIKAITNKGKKLGFGPDVIEALKRAVLVAYGVY